MDKKEVNSVIIVGCSRLGANIATMLSKQGKEVVILDTDLKSFDKLSRKFTGFSLTGDGTDVDVLKDSGINKADLVVATTDNDNTNIMISELAKTIFKVPKVISRIYDTEKEPVYYGLDINVIRPFELSINEFERLLCGEEC